MGGWQFPLPIIIHLLNKRKFKIVDWAAMEFLLDAEKKNRRRVRLENLILLLLRCLAVLLIGLLLARPFIPTSMTAGLLNAAQFERIVLLDDSLSHAGPPWQRIGLGPGPQAADATDRSSRRRPGRQLADADFHIAARQAAV